MDSGIDQFTPVKEVNGINLDNYFPHRSSFNTVIYVHKRFLKKYEKEHKKEEIVKKREHKKTFTEDKAVHCDFKEIRNKKEELRKDSVLSHTIKFAKNLAPILIPPSEGNESPIFYTIKTCSKCRKRHASQQQHEKKCEKRNDSTFDKKKSMKLIEMYKKDKKIIRESSISGRNSISHSSQSTTLDQSLCCTLSEMSDKKEKANNKVSYNKRKRIDSEKIAISESVEGLALESNNINETRIKIQLMNDQEKHFLSESIQIPILEAVTDCLKELNNAEVREDVQSVQRTVKYNSQKLDCILEKLTSIENHLANAKIKIVTSPKAKGLKANTSRLEQLGQDLSEERDYSSEEEKPKLESMKKINKAKVSLVPDRIENVGGGETTEVVASTSVGVRTDKHRIPARFCWTDAT